MKKNHWDRVKDRTMSGKVSSRIKSLYENGDPIKVILYNNLCPGDLLIMTAAIESLHQQYPGRFITDVACFHSTLFDNNPHITKLNPNEKDVIHLWTTYPLVNKTNQRPIHFLEGYVDWFRTQFDIDLVLDVNRPYIYLTDEEKKNSFVNQTNKVSKYIVCSTGWKNDYTIKRWSVPYMQEVVDHFQDKIKFVQIGMSRPFHNHPPLKNVIDLIDKTSIRQLVNVCYHAQAGVGPITCIQHMFAAFQRPYVVLHGAREPTFWTAYHTQKVFSNIGTLECCKTQACWRSRIVPLGDGDKKDKRCCELPQIDSDNRPIAKCMFDIKPKHVIEAIEAWIDGGIIKGKSK
jgi:ADP-heptose:LPS heptosyltransferase